MRDLNARYLSIASGDLFRHPVQTAPRGGMMKPFLRLFWRAWGCHHRRLSRVFTIRRRTYKICCDCGREFNYLQPGQPARGHTPIRIAGFVRESVAEQTAA